MAPSTNFTIAGTKTKITLFVINVLKVVLQLAAIYCLHAARSSTLDNIPFWAQFGSPNATFAQFIVNIARSFAALPLLGIPWVFLCLILDFSGVSRDATDISVVVSFDILAICSVIIAVSLIIASYRSLKSGDNKEIEKIYFSKHNHGNSSTVTQLLCLNVVRYSASKTIACSWALSVICVFLSMSSHGLAFLFIDWETRKDKKKGMTKSEAASLVQSEISKAVPSLQKKETVVAIDAAQPLMSEPTSQSSD